MIDEFPDEFIQDFGVPCSKGGDSFTALFDMPDQNLVLGGINVQSTEYALVAKTEDVQRLAIVAGDDLAVDGNPFVVREVSLVDDGVFTRITLSR